MFVNLVNVFRWSASLGVKFLQVVSLHTALIVIFTLVSQVSTLLASFMPLKVVILLGSEGIPSYFPGFLTSFNRDAVIVGLSIATLGFFVLHLFAERLVSWSTRKGTHQLLDKSHKMVLFENQDIIAAGGFQQYSRALAGGVFIMLSLSGLGWFYPEMALVIISYTVLTFCILGLLHRHSVSFREQLRTKLRDLLNVVSGIGFFVAFGYLVMDFIVWSNPGVIIAIVTLVLCRQMMARVTGLAMDLASLYQQKVKLDALFFHGKVLLSESTHHSRSIWPLLQPTARPEWIRGVLKEFTNDKVDRLRCTWHQTGIVNIAAVSVETDTGLYFIKLFEKNRSSFALHESTLMAEKVSKLPAAHFLGATQIQDYQCLLYQLPNGRSPLASEVLPHIQPLRRKLLAVELPVALCQRYQRSRPMLWQRLNVDLLNHLRMAITSDEQLHMLEWLIRHLAQLNGILQALPVVLHQPDFTADAIWLTDETSPIALNWGQWSLEPLGAGWPEGEKGLEQLAPAVQEASQGRSALCHVAIHEAELSALAFALERDCNRQRYVQALELLPAMLERMTVTTSSSNGKGVVNE
ncbi:hypothetical protein ELY33_14580 [Vreelandella andesensis]|uniref:Uncharacterized protein n=1 Tax=Vreelandella andesensis TaxID=447567 RepID=A0A433KGL5_9GAMM|nr:hypothetical protein [Halomonas andesensis]RUR27818.1 hypothetical protein ELY33_14580 [Halomonas andesensis]